LRVVWNTSHQEFTVFDYYYFSSLELFLRQRAIIVENKLPLDKVRFSEKDILVINYPEIEFRSEEINSVSKFVNSGGRLIVAAYYQNEDNVAQICSSFLSFVGIEFGEGAAIDPTAGLLGTAQITSDAKNQLPKIDFEKVFFPCACPVISTKGLPLLEIAGEPVAYYVKQGEGEVIALGTAVFWDNFAIDKEENWKFVEWLFSRS
jgi:hypothetical protein